MPNLEYGLSMKKKSEFSRKVKKSVRDSVTRPQSFNKMQEQLIERTHTLCIHTHLEVVVKLNQQHH